MVAQVTTTAPVPFFEDTRTLAEKLECEKREWRPHQPEHDCPSVIYGLVIERGTYTSSYDREEPRETARILTADNVEWSVIAFHGYLQSEFKRKDPRVGDFAAAAYRGTKPAKRPGENDAHDYLMEIERNPTMPLSTPSTVLVANGDTEAADSDAHPQEADEDIPF